MSPVTPQTERSGRLALLTGLSTTFIAAAFAYHRVHFFDYPLAGLDSGALMLAYLAAGILFEFGVPVLCLATFVFGTLAWRSWPARIGIVCAAAALAAYALYVRALLEIGV